MIKHIVEYNQDLDEDAAQRGQGVKIMTASKLITRLPILLSQVKAGNNSQKLKN